LFHTRQEQTIITNIWIKRIVDIEKEIQRQKIEIEYIKEQISWTNARIDNMWNIRNEWQIKDNERLLKLEEEVRKLKSQRQTKTQTKKLDNNVEIVAELSTDWVKSSMFSDWSIVTIWVWNPYTAKNLVQLWIEQSIAETIIFECLTASMPSHCIESIVWVSSAESSIFKKCYLNNCMGLMRRWKVLPYTSKEEKVKDRVKRYNEFRYNNNTASDWLNRSKYCTSECENRINNFNSWVAKLKATLR
jgi:hypothetical protein